MLKGTQAYVQTKYSTIGQGEILIMLYDGALKFLNGAKEKIEAKDYAAKGILISKTMDIVHELDSSLNMELGGDLAQNLHQLYFLCSTRLLQANLKMDTGIIDSVIGILSGLRDAYAQIIHTPEAMAAAEKIATRLAPASAAQSKGMALPTKQAPTGATRATMRSAYSQQSIAPATHPDAAPQPGPTPTGSTLTATIPPVASAPGLAASPVASGSGTSFASMLSQAASGTPGVESAPVSTATISPSVPATAPVADLGAASGVPDMPVVPIAPVIPPVTAPVNLASRRLAATARYGKVSESM